MVDKILSIYENDLKQLGFIERYGGLSQIFVRQMEDHVEVFPIAWNANPELDEHRLQELVPNANYKSVAYFEQLGSITTSFDTLAGGRKRVVYSTQLRFIIWVNTPAIGLEELSTTYVLFPRIRQVLTKRIKQIPEDHPLKKYMVKAPQISNVILESKDETRSNVFGRYSFSEERALFYPYDFFSFTFDIDWSINEKCFEELDISPIQCIDLN